MTRWWLALCWLAVFVTTCMCGGEHLDEDEDKVVYKFTEFQYKDTTKNENSFREYESACEQTPSCTAKTGPARFACVRDCISPSCHRELYADDPLEEGEIDRMPRRQRTCLTVSEKCQLIAEVDGGAKKTDVALRYGIPLSTLCTILKKRDYLHQNAFHNRNNKRVKVCRYDAIDKIVSQWVAMQRGRGLRITGPLIKAKAMEVAKTLNHTSFQASTGWLDKFKARHSIMFRNKCYPGSVVSWGERFRGLEEEDGESIECVPTIHTDSDTVRWEEEEDIEEEEEEDMEEDEDGVDVVRKPAMGQVMAAFDLIRRALQEEEGVPDQVFQALNTCEVFYQRKRRYENWLPRNYKERTS